MIRECIDSAVGVVTLFLTLWLAMNLELINTPDGLGFMVDGLGGYFWQYSIDPTLTP